MKDKYNLIEDKFYTLRVFFGYLTLVFVVISIGFVVYRINIDKNTRDLEDYRSSFYKYFDGYVELRKSYCLNEKNVDYVKYCGDN